MTPLGYHMLIDYHGCNPDRLRFAADVQSLIVEAVKKAHGTYVADTFHNFSPHGVSGVVVIAESHVTIHTWPEFGYAAVDIFCCSQKLDRKLIRNLLKTAFESKQVRTRNLTRGIMKAREFKSV